MCGMSCPLTKCHTLLNQFVRGKTHNMLSFYHLAMLLNWLANFRGGRVYIHLSLNTHRHHNYGCGLYLQCRLREKCVQILLLSCSYRRKAEELLWKKGFYELTQRSKSNKQVQQHSTQVHYVSSVKGFELYI